MRKLTLILASAAVLAACDKGPKVAQVPWNSYRNPVVQANTEDPSVVVTPEKFYVFYNGSDEDNVLPLMESTDLVKWEDLTPSFNALTSPEPVSGGTLKACCVVPGGNGYLLYYTASGSSKSVIGVAESEFPTGPWTDVGTVLEKVSEEAGYGSAPSVYSDGGAMYMAVETAKGIFSVKLSSNGKYIEAASPVKLTSEALTSPAMFSYEGKWYLMATKGSIAGGASSTARIVYGRSDSPSGPFFTSSGAQMLDGEGDTLVESGKKFAGPGRANAPVQLSDGSWWLVYNAYDLSDVSKGRTLMLDPVFWEDGWMKVRGGVSSFCSDMPSINR